MWRMLLIVCAMSDDEAALVACDAAWTPSTYSTEADCLGGMAEAGRPAEIVTQAWASVTRERRTLKWWLACSLADANA